MADYIPGLAISYRSSFSPVPPPRRPALPTTTNAHARSHSVSAPKTSSLTPTPEVSLRRSHSHKTSNAASNTSFPHAPAISSPLARTSSPPPLTGQEPNPHLQETMPLQSTFKSLRERSSRIFRRPAMQSTTSLQISSPVPALSMARTPQNDATSASDNSSAMGSATPSTKSVCRRAGVAAQGKRLQKKRQPGVLAGAAQEAEVVSTPPASTSGSIDHGDGEPSRRFSRAPQLPTLDFEQPEVVPSALEASPESVDQGEEAVVEYAKYRVDIHATSGADFRSSMAECKQRVLSGGGVVVEDMEYLSGFIYEWPAHRDNVLENGESTALGGHIDVLVFVPAPAVAEPLRSHPYTAPKDRTSEKAKAKMERSKQKLMEHYGLEVEMGSPSLGVVSDEEEDQGEWEDIE